MISCRQDGDALVFEVHVQPGARRQGVLGVHDGALKVGVSAAPEKGKANKALAGLLGEALGVRRSDVTIIKGEHRRLKVVRVSGVSQEDLQSLAEG